VPCKQQTELLFYGAATFKDGFSYFLYTTAAIIIHYLMVAFEPQLPSCAFFLKTFKWSQTLKSFASRLKSSIGLGLFAS